MSHIQSFIHGVHVETGYSGNIEFDFAPGIYVQFNLDPDPAQCAIVMINNDCVINGDDALNLLDRIDRQKTFGLLPCLKHAAQRRSDEEFSYISHEAFPLVNKK